jgi:DNA-binding XRE family transcriptional regulator
MTDNTQAPPREPNELKLFGTLHHITAVGMHFRFSVCESSIFNWESNRSKREIRLMATIIQFFGYNPLPEANSLAENLVRRRTTLGLSREGAATEIGVDAATLARWERGEREPLGEFLVHVQRFLGDEMARNESIRRAG